ncbi:ATP-binding protein [uncultured Roseobacter sp.]|uniref:ATP-binding protein n=1 Tax=uncultured Roseobacter sp. TaxID=114847 RepID=UPI002623A605|nr:ATP-binding protein [uncultured Roseobacter sp.]
MTPPQNDQLSLLDLLEKPPIEALYSPDQIYDSEDVTLFSRLTEDHRFDRKSARTQPKELAKYLSAFGNGPSVDGGVLAIGIENDGTVSGCAHLDQDGLSKIERLGENACPDGRFETKREPVTNASGDEDFIVLARIRYVEGKLVELANGEAYERLGDECKKLSDSKKQEIRIDKGERSFEQEPCGLVYPDDFDENAIARFAKIVTENASTDLQYSRTDILRAYHLGRERSGTFVCNNACAVLFAQDPVTVFPGLLVHFLRYEGTEALSGKRYNVVKDRMVSGTIVEVIREAANLIDSSVREFTEFRDGKFFTVPEYPRDAWYEMLVNACVHRSFNIRNAPVFVRMFDDRIEVESPGGFMPQITPETIVGTHRPRNPFVMRSLREFGEVRCISEGTRRMVAEMTAANLPPPEFKQRRTDNLSVICTLRNNVRDRSNSLDSDAYKSLGQAVAFSLTPEERKIVNYLVEHGKINVSGALRILTTTRWHTARDMLVELEKRGILDYVSSGKPRDAHSHYRLADRNG